MAHQTTAEQRSEFYRRHLRGETYAQIAEGCGVSLECVRYWCQRQQRGQGVVSQYHIPERGALSQFSEGLRQKISELREAHPGWGPVSLRMHLSDEASLKGERLPSVASIGRYLHEDPKNRRAPKKSGVKSPKLR